MLLHDDEKIFALKKNLPVDELQNKLPALKNSTIRRAGLQQLPMQVKKETGEISMET